MLSQQSVVAVGLRSISQIGSSVLLCIAPSPSLRAFRAGLGVALGGLGCWLAALRVAGGWNWMGAVGLCSPGHSVIL